MLCVHAEVTEQGNVVARCVKEGEYRYEQQGEYCTCMIEQRAQDVNTGAIGSAEDTPVIRFIKSLATDDRTPFEDCGTCGKQVCAMGSN